jgi:hypothetical protein
MQMGWIGTAFQFSSRGDSPADFHHPGGGISIRSPWPFPLQSHGACGCIIQIRLLLVFSGWGRAGPSPIHYI